MLAEHQFISGHAHRFRRHDLVTERIADHSVLMYTGFVRKSIAPDDGLVWLHLKTNDPGQQLTGRIKLSSIDPRFKGQPICAYPNGHGNLFQRSVPGAFADPVDRTFNLP